MSNSNPPKSATIEDKLNYILNGINVDGYPEENWFSETKAEILSLITTETTNARKEAWDDCALHIAMQHYMLSAGDFKKIMFATRSELGSKKADTEHTDLVATDLNQAEDTQSRPVTGVQKEQKQ